MAIHLIEDTLFLMDKAVSFFSKPRYQKASTNRGGVRGGRRLRTTKKIQNVVGKVIFDLGTKVLTDSDTVVLDKGLKYVPPRILDKFQTYMDVHKFVRKLNKWYMTTNPIEGKRLVTTDFHYFGLSNASLFNPSGALAPSLKVFRDVTLSDFSFRDEKS